MLSSVQECRRSVLQFAPGGRSRTSGAGQEASRGPLDVFKLIHSDAHALAASQTARRVPRAAAEGDQGTLAEHEPKVAAADRSDEVRPTESSDGFPAPFREPPDTMASGYSSDTQSPVAFLHAADDEALDPCSLIDPLFNVTTVYIKEEIEEQTVGGFVKSEAILGLDKASTNSAGMGMSSAALLGPGEACGGTSTGGSTGMNSAAGAPQLLLLAKNHERPQGLTPLGSYSTAVGKRIFKEGILQWLEDENMFDMVKRISKAKNPEPKIHQCPQCGFTFARKRCLERHMMAKHSDIRPYRCSLCEYSSAFKSCLKKHTLVKHSGMKPFQCTHCEYSTPYRKDLDRHIMVRHSSFRPFQCSLCDFSCADISNLKRHTRVKHFGVSPYHCTQCEYSSADKSNLRRHIKAKHSDDKPFQCSLCECAYSRKDKLKYHFRTKHGDL